MYTADRQTVTTAGPRICPKGFNCYVSPLLHVNSTGDTDCSRSQCWGDGDTAETLTADDRSVCLSALPQEQTSCRDGWAVTDWLWLFLLWCRQDQHLEAILELMVGPHHPELLLLHVKYRPYMSQAQGLGDSIAGLPREVGKSSGKARREGPGQAGTV